MSRKKKPEESLPAGCSICKGHPWVEGTNGMKRCGCARGRDLARRTAEREGRKGPAPAPELPPDAKTLAAGELW